MPMTRSSTSSFGAALAVLVLVPALPAHAQDEVVPTDIPTRADAAKPALPRWEVGAVGFGATQPAYPGAEENTSRALVLPYLVYRGEVLRSDRSGVGVRTLKTARFELDVGFAGSLGASANKVEARRGMDDIGILVEMGPQLKINLTDVADGPGSSRFELPLRGVFDLEDSLRLKGLTFDPAWVTTTRLVGPWVGTFTVSAQFGNRRLAGVFYDVKPWEATATRPEYRASAGLIAWRAGFSVSRPIGRDMRFFAFVRQDSLAGAANLDSPLVKERSGTAAGLGLTWTWLRSVMPAAD